MYRQSKSWWNLSSGKQQHCTLWMKIETRRRLKGYTGTQGGLWCLRIEQWCLYIGNDELYTTLSHTYLKCFCHSRIVLRPSRELFIDAWTKVYVSGWILRPAQRASFGERPLHYEYMKKTSTIAHGCSDRSMKTTKASSSLQPWNWKEKNYPCYFPKQFKSFSRKSWFVLKATMNNNF